MMVLPPLKRLLFIDRFEEICQCEGFEKSTWTIDLCYILKRFSEDFIFYTSVAGVNPDHTSQYFYENILSKVRPLIQAFNNIQENLDTDCLIY